MPTAKLLVDTAIELRWRDLDALNHVNNASFLTFFEETRLRWFATLTAPWSSQTSSPVLAAVQINYRRQLSWPQAVRAELSCERIGNTSLTLAHRLVDARDDRIVFADGTSVLVWIDPQTGKPIALPDAVVAACR